MKEYKYKINGNTYKVAVGDIDNNIAQVEVNGTPYKVELDSQKAPVKIINSPRPAAAPRTESGAKVIASAPAAAGGYQVKAPLPGTVISIPVKVGDTVEASTTVVVLEAMKMENAIRAGRAGKIASIAVNNGDAVPDGAVMVTIE
ncbi:MAG: acetyl-CoA carboxylase biotin carboxyl carrier protein subunit [Paramuribaculum sp.]|nr:acetyl-CoA carboxylase biotin carboxyl carrier protein subunit [Paramuribaculum sp.]